MGDMGDFWRVVNAARKERRAKERARAESQAIREATLPWTKHTDYHWSLDVGGHRLDYWPTAEHFRYRGESILGGIRKVEKFAIARMVEGAEQGGGDE